MADAFVVAVDGVNVLEAAGGLMVFENRYEDAVELFDGFGGAVEGVHQGFASAADVGLGYSLSFRQLGTGSRKAACLRGGRR